MYKVLLYRPEFAGNSTYSTEISRTIYDDTKFDNTRTILSGVVKTSVSDIPAFDFVILPNHPLYDQIIKFKTTITVYRGTRVLFYGRVLNDKVDIYGQKTVSCEGAIGFLLDSILAPFSTETITPKALLQQIITAHNTDMASEPYKQFTIGNVTVTKRKDGADVGMDSSALSKKFKLEEYQQTRGIIDDMLLKDYKGYLFARYANGVLYLDWLKEFNTTNSQPIKMEVNLLDQTVEQDANDYYTVYLPIGQNKKTIETVNDGSKYLIDTEGLSKYGRIVKAESFSDCKTAAELLEKARETFERRRSGLPLSVHIKAVDMNLLGAQVDGIYVGDVLANYAGALPEDRLFAQYDEAVEAGSGYHDICGELMTKYFQLGNVNLLTRPQVSASAISAAGYSDAGTGTATVFTISYSAGDEESDGMEYNQNIILHVTPIKANGTVVTQSNLDSYMDSLLSNNTIDGILNADKPANGGNGLVLWIQRVSNWEFGWEKADLYDECLHGLQALYYLEDDEDAPTSVELKQLLDKCLIVAEVSNDLMNPSNDEFVAENQEAIDKRNGDAGNGSISSRAARADNGLDEDRKRLIKHYEEVLIRVDDTWTIIADTIRETSKEHKIYTDTLWAIFGDGYAQSYLPQHVKAVEVDGQTVYVAPLSGTMTHQSQTGTTTYVQDISGVVMERRPYVNPETGETEYEFVPKTHLDSEGNEVYDLVTGEAVYETLEQARQDEVHIPLRSISRQTQTEFYQIIGTTDIAHALNIPSDASEATTFDPTHTYVRGDYVYHEDGGVLKLYVFTQNHTGAWNASHVTEVHCMTYERMTGSNIWQSEDQIVSVVGTVHVTEYTPEGAQNVTDFQDNWNYAPGDYCKYPPGALTKYLYQFTASHYGPWTGTDVKQISTKMVQVDEGAGLVVYKDGTQLGLYKDGELNAGLVVSAINDHETEAKIKASRVAIQSVSGSGIEIDQNGNITVTVADVVNGINSDASLKINANRINLNSGAVIKAINGGTTGASELTIDADKLNLTGYVRADELETDVATIFSTGVDNISVDTQFDAGEDCQCFFDGPVYLGEESLRNSVIGFGTATSSGGQISIPFYTFYSPSSDPDSSNVINFNIADTAFYQSHVGIRRTNSWVWSTEDGEYTRFIEANDGTSTTIAAPMATVDAGYGLNQNVTIMAYGPADSHGTVHEMSVPSTRLTLYLQADSNYAYITNTSGTPTTSGTSQNVVARISNSGGGSPVITQDGWKWTSLDEYSNKIEVTVGNNTDSTSVTLPNIFLTATSFDANYDATVTAYGPADTLGQSHAVAQSVVIHAATIYQDGYIDGETDFKPAPNSSPHFAINVGAGNGDTGDRLSNWNQLSSPVTNGTGGYYVATAGTGNSASNAVVYMVIHTSAYNAAGTLLYNSSNANGYNVVMQAPITNVYKDGYRTGYHNGAGISSSSLFNYVDDEEEYDDWVANTTFSLSKMYNRLRVLDKNSGEYLIRLNCTGVKTAGWNAAAAITSIPPTINTNTARFDVTIPTNNNNQATYHYDLSADDDFCYVKAYPSNNLKLRIDNPAKLTSAKIDLNGSSQATSQTKPTTAITKANGVFSGYIWQQLTDGTWKNIRSFSISMPGTSTASWNRSQYGTSGQYIYSCTVAGQTYTHVF